MISCFLICFSRRSKSTEFDIYGWLLLIFFFLVSKIKIKKWKQNGNITPARRSKRTHVFVCHGWTTIECVFISAFLVWKKLVVTYALIMKHPPTHSGSCEQVRDAKAKMRHAFLQAKQLILYAYHQISILLFTFIFFLTHFQEPYVRYVRVDVCTCVSVDFFFHCIGNVSVSVTFSLSVFV